MKPSEARKLKYELTHISLSNILKENLKCELFELNDSYNIDEIRISLNEITEILCKKLSYDDITKIHELTYKNFNNEDR